MHVRCCFIATVRKYVRKTANLGRRVSDALLCVVATVRSCSPLVKCDYIYSVHYSSEYDP